MAAGRVTTVVTSAYESFALAVSQRLEFNRGIVEPANTRSGSEVKLRQNLDGDITAGPDVCCTISGSHATRAQRVLNNVRT
jgi:hypothetical protein